MGIRIDGTSDLINAADGSLTVEGLSINVSGVVTASDGFKVGSAATIHSTGQFNIGVAHTLFANGNATFAGIVTASNTTISSTGIGIGAATNGSANYPSVTISGNSGGAVHFEDDGDLLADIYGSSDGLILSARKTNDAITFQLNSGSVGEKARFDSSGRLLIGSVANSHNGGDLLQLSATSSTASIQLNRYTANAHPSYLNFFKSRNASISGQTVVQDDDTLGMLAFYGSDGTDRALGAEVCAQVDGTPGSDDMPTRLVFRTSADGSQSPTERIRVYSDGCVGVGTMGADSRKDGHLQVETETTDRYAASFANHHASGSKGIRVQACDSDESNWIILAENRDGTNRFGVRGTGNVEVHDGNLVIGTSGHGIDFSAGTGQQGTGGEVLTDFEYGTWTPTLYFLTNNGGITYTTQQGDYTKVGNRVFFSFSIQVNSIGSSAGNVLVWGLPYQVNQPTNGVNAPSSVSLFPISKLNITGDAFCGQITSQPDIELYNVTWGTGNNYSATQASQIADDFFLKGQGHYCTDS